MRFLAAFFLIITMLNCTAQGKKSSFDEFSSKFREVRLPLQIRDSIEFYNWNSEDTIAINYVKDYNLIAKYMYNEYPMELQDYRCTYIGKYKMDNLLVLLYKTLTTDAGNGNAILVITTFTDKGRKIDEVIALWDNVWDPLYFEKESLHIPNGSTFTITSIKEISGLLKNELVLKRVTERIINYEITKDGTIVKRDDTVRVLFEDNNPDILDDFPEY